MQLDFPIIKITPKSGLGDKFARLGLSPTMERMYSKIKLYNNESETIFEGDCIIDTGATISLLPGSILKYYTDLVTEKHVMWGVINKKGV